MSEQAAAAMPRIHGLLDEFEAASRERPTDHTRHVPGTAAEERYQSARAAVLREQTTALQPPAVSVDGELRRALQRISEATPRSTNSATADDMRTWCKAVADTALASSTQPEAAGQAVRNPYKLPEGWKLVPLSLTDEMRNAMQERLCDLANSTYFNDEHQMEMYEAALDAAPQPVLPAARSNPSLRNPSECRAGSNPDQKPAIPAGYEEPWIDGEGKPWYRPTAQAYGVVCIAYEKLSRKYAALRREYGLPMDYQPAPLAGDASGDVDVALKEVERLRSEGWSVAIHNDYRLNGEPHTFWLFTHANGQWIKGEGRTDAEALTAIRALANPSATLRQEDAGAAKVGRFGHHPDPSTDFCIEVEDMEGYADELLKGLNHIPPHRSQWPFWARLSKLLAFTRSSDMTALDSIAQRALPVVAGLEAKALGKKRPTTTHHRNGEEPRWRRAWLNGCQFPYGLRSMKP